MIPVMQTPTLDQIMSAYVKKNYSINKGFRPDGKFQSFDLNPFGIRSEKGMSDPNLIDQFCDLLGCFYYVTTDKPILFIKQGTTRPGKYFKEHPMNPGGSFIMIPGQNKQVYKIGSHNGQDALIQCGTLTGFRDNSCTDTFKLDPKNEFIGSDFFVDIHTLETQHDNIGLSSAGCQVFANIEEQKQFMELVHNSWNVWCRLFDYTLLTEQDVFG